MVIYCFDRKRIFTYHQLVNNYGVYLQQLRQTSTQYIIHMLRQFGIQVLSMNYETFRKDTLENTKGGNQEWRIQRYKPQNEDKKKIINTTQKTKLK